MYNVILRKTKSAPSSIIDEYPLCKISNHVPCLHSTEMGFPHQQKIIELIGSKLLSVKLVSHRGRTHKVKGVLSLWRY